MNIGDRENLLEFQYRNTEMLDIRILLHQNFSTNKYGWHNWVFDQLSEIDPNSKILELGSGNGQLWMKNIQRINESWDVTLSDFSPGMLGKLKKCLENQTSFQFEIIDAQMIPFSANSFDVVIANHMLYHVPNLEKVLLEVRRILRSDGVFFATTMGLRNMLELRKLVNEFDSSIEFPLGTASKIFGLENGEAKLKPYFENIEIRYYEDSLKIPEVEPLVNYILTFTGIGNVVEVIKGEKLEQFKNFVQSRMDEDGYINISKSAGIFIAR